MIRVRNLTDHVVIIRTNPRSDLEIYEIEPHETKYVPLCRALHKLITEKQILTPDGTIIMDFSYIIFQAFPLYLRPDFRDLDSEWECSALL